MTSADPHDLQCVDVTLADPSEVAEVNSSNCQNATNFAFNMLFTSSSQQSAASPSLASPPTVVTLLTTLVLISVAAGTTWF